VLLRRKDSSAQYTQSRFGFDIGLIEVRSASGAKNEDINGRNDTHSRKKKAGAMPLDPLVDKYALRLENRNKLS
jgi:hypothetical protein